MEKSYHIFKLGTGLSPRPTGDPIATVTAKNHSRALKAHFGEKQKIEGRGSNCQTTHEGYWNVYVAREVKP